MPERRAAKSTASMPAGRRRAAGRSSKRRKVGALSWHSAASSARAACVACRPCRCAFQSRKIRRPTSLRAFAIVLGEMREAGVRHGTGDPAPAFPALYRKSSVPYYSNWCSPPPSRGEHRHCQILSPRLSGAFVVPGQVAVLLVALRNGEPCPASSNWCFALIPLGDYGPC